MQLLSSVFCRLVKAKTMTVTEIERDHSLFSKYNGHYKNMSTRVVSHRMSLYNKKAYLTGDRQLKDLIALLVVILTTGSMRRQAVDLEGDVILLSYRKNIRRRQVLLQLPCHYTFRILVAFSRFVWITVSRGTDSGLWPEWWPNCAEPLLGHPSLRGFDFCFL